MQKKYSIKKIVIGRSILLFRFIKKIVKINYFYVIFNYFNFAKNRIIKKRSTDYIVIDGGTNLFQGFEHLFNSKIINNQFIGYLFEPNPNCIPYIEKKIKEKKFSDMSLTIVQKALSDMNTTVNLRIEHVPGEHRLQYTDEIIGHGTYMGGATSILGDEWIKPAWIDDNNFVFEEINTIKTSEFLLSNFEINSYIVCKLDVEGSEFKILENLINEDCLKYFNEAYIEWHPQHNSDYSLKDVTNLKKKMIRKGIYVGFWL